MKRFITACAITAVLALPVVAEVATPNANLAPTNMSCPMMGAMMGGMGDMQKNMGAMAKEMSAMMSGTNDPSMKERMQKMHDQMVDMMSNMGGMMGRAMIGGGMMGGQMMQGTPKSDTDTMTPNSTDEHKSHHPDQ